MRQRIIHRAMIGAVLGALVMAGAWERTEDRIEGEVRSVDSESGVLTLSGGKQLAVGLGTRVRKDGSLASLDDIKEGDRVQASFSHSVAALLGQKTLQERVNQVVATSQAGGPHSAGGRGGAM